MSHALIAASFHPGTNVEEHQTMETWHNRLCHISHAVVKQLTTLDLVAGIQLLNSPSLDNFFCEGCCKGKQHRTLFPVNSPRIRTVHPGDLLHADLMGPIDPVSVGGASYCLLVKDDATGYRLVFCIPQKSDTLACIQQAVLQVLCNTRQTVKVIRTDRGGEFVNKAATKFYDESLIYHELTAPYNPEQNGAAKLENRTVMELVRSMIHSRNVPPKFWAKATHTAVYVLNKTLSRTLPRTPFESWYQRKPSLSHLHTFGCPAYIYAEKHTQTKLESKSRPGIFMGYTEENKAYHVWDTTKDKIVVTRDVIFHETSVPSPSASPLAVSPPPSLTIHFPSPPLLLLACPVSSSLPVLFSLASCQSFSPSPHSQPTAPPLVFPDTSVLLTGTPVSLPNPPMLSPASNWVHIR
jgi:hypothetical protein